MTCRMRIEGVARATDAMTAEILTPYGFCNDQDSMATLIHRAFHIGRANPSLVLVPK